MKDSAAVMERVLDELFLGPFLVYHEDSRVLVQRVPEVVRKRIFEYVKTEWLVVPDDNPSDLRRATIRVDNMADSGEYLTGGRFAFVPSTESVEKLPHVDLMRKHVRTYFDRSDECERGDERFTLFFSLSRRDQILHEDDEDKCFLTTIVPLTPDENPTLFYSPDESLLEPVFGTLAPWYSFPGTECLHKGQKNKHDVRIAILIENRKSAHEPSVAVFEDKGDGKRTTLWDIFKDFSNVNVDDVDKTLDKCYVCDDHEGLRACAEDGCDAMVHDACVQPDHLCPPCAERKNRLD
jgi:hypothetical protein